MDRLGIPMPDPCIVTGFPRQVPVNPSIPRTSLTQTASSRNVCAAHSARFGSPGIRTVSAISPGAAPIWIVISNREIVERLAFFQGCDHPIWFAPAARPCLARIRRIGIFRCALTAFGSSGQHIFQRKPEFLGSLFRSPLGLCPAPRVDGLQRFLGIGNQFLQFFLRILLQIQVHVLTPVLIDILLFRPALEVFKCFFVSKSICVALLCYRIDFGDSTLGLCKSFPARRKCKLSFPERKKSKKGNPTD